MITGFTAVRALIAEGARIGLTTCKTCGAAIVLDAIAQGEDGIIDPLALHDRWHTNRGELAPA